MQFRDATMNDLPVIVDIYNATIPGRMIAADTEPVTVADRTPWLDVHNSFTRPLWMVEVDNQIISSVSYNNFYGRPAYNGTAEISIYLQEHIRGKGDGKKILNHCIATASSLQIHTLLGIIFSHNNQSIQLFKNSGFEEWGMLKEIAVMDEKN